MTDKDADEGVLCLENQNNKSEAESCQVQMTKSQMKKLVKRQRILEKRPERRRLEKERKKAKKAELMKLRLVQGEDQHVAVNIKKTKLMSDSDNKFRVVIDMDFEEFMTDDEIGKAAKQVGRIYSLNRHSERPCQLYLSSMKEGRLLERFSRTNGGYKNWDINVSANDYRDIFRQDCDNIIYLTGDTDALLPSADELLKDESKIFVIGGLVDHNRHKNLCFQRAQERNIKTAKLPIKEHVDLCQRHILSTVTVFEILLSVISSRLSWRDALLGSIPKRKLACDQETRRSVDEQREASKEAMKE